MIQKIRFKFGPAPGLAAAETDVTPITVFVGPNNAGKSKALLEIEAASRTFAPTDSNVIIDNLTFAAWTKAEIEQELSDFEVVPEPNERIQSGYILISKLHPQNNQSVRSRILRDSVVQQAQNPQYHNYHYAEFLNLFILRMDGTNRLNLVNEQSAGDLQMTAPNLIAHLFKNNDVRAELRRIVYDAFGKYLVIDPTNIGSLRMRLSERAPSSEREEKGWEEASVRFHGSAVDIRHASDGVRAFVGIISTILAGNPRITLIDEPEAFLHPALASRLGKEIGRSLAGSKKRLFVSTHSAQFLMGCIQSGAPLSIVRLTYNYRSPTARILPQDKILHLMRHPLLRSTGVLNGLFYESVIVTESDSDRAFYQEINERLLAANDSRGIQNCLFLNAQNKQTVWEIVRPLRELGIPAAGIVDIDVLKEGGQVWAKPLEGAFIPALNHRALQDQRQVLLSAFESTRKNMKRDGGINLLGRNDREACENLFEMLRAYGIFVVPGGELESWLAQLGAVGHGPAWLIDMFERLGENPDNAAYLKPGTGDVWDFMSSVRQWIGDPARKGIPS